MSGVGLPIVPNMPARLKELRQEMGWSLRDVAERVGVTQKGVVSNWEAENQRFRIPGLETMLTLQRWYGVSLDYLIGQPGAERDSPSVKQGKRALARELAQVEGLEKMLPPDRAQLALSLVMELAPGAFFKERLAPLLFVATEEVDGLAAGALWGDQQIQALAQIIGVRSEWFYAPVPSRELLNV